LGARSVRTLPLNLWPLRECLAAGYDANSDKAESCGVSMPDGPTKYCDLVMKGGITSGIVYPNAVLALAKEFRFKSIGGTSAGAIAAAASAAAAMGDRRKQAGAQIAHPSAKVGFEGLAQVSDRLSSAGFIYSLFQPAGGARNAYRLIVLLAGNAGRLRKVAGLMFAVPAIAPLETVTVLGSLLGLGYWMAEADGIWAALMPSLLCAYLVGAISAVSRVARVARRNLLGLCSGLSTKTWLSSAGGAKPALTDWLHLVLQELSGKPFDDPLTFADLWAAERYPGEPKTDKAINLQMITTGVSHHEPRTLPFVKARFWFRREEFDLLFPKSIVDWLVAQAGEPNEISGVRYFQLPAGEKLPVLVGMRMSLSFPLLISAVPLHEPATRSPRPKPESQAAPATETENSVSKSMEALATGGEEKEREITAFRICWFSDGGISSNFPIHLFDAPLPLWPTFAIDLLYPKSDDGDHIAPVAGQAEEQSIEASVFLPTENNQGWQRTYQSITRTSAAGELAGFLFGIIATMQNWRDLLQSRAPGHRDRIVHISLSGVEGGMNLNMQQPVLNRIASKGAAAGNLLKSFSFENHYWIRWRILASALQRHTMGVAASDERQPKIPDYVGAYQLVKANPADAPSYKFSSQEKRDEAQKLFGQLVAKGKEWEDLGPDLSQESPRPLPQMRIVPTY